MSAALDRLVHHVPYNRFMDVRVQRLGDELTAHLPFSDAIVGNPLLPAIHGGVTGAFMEITAQIQLVWDQVIDLEAAEEPSCETVVIPKTIDVTIDFLRSGRPRETFARAEVQKAGRRVANVHVSAWQDDKARPIAMMRGNFLMPEDPA